MKPYGHKRGDNERHDNLQTKARQSAKHIISSELNDYIPVHQQYIENIKQAYGFKDTIQYYQEDRDDLFSYSMISEEEDEFYKNTAMEVVVYTTKIGCGENISIYVPWKATKEEITKKVNEECGSLGWYSYDIIGHVQNKKL